MNEQPGYIDINGTQIHVAELRHHTGDIHRFREYLPAALELAKHEPRSAQWFEVLDSSPDIGKLQATVAELGRIQTAMANTLRNELEAQA